MERKAVFFDIDGTLAAGYYRVFPSALEAVRAAQKNGTLCIVCTGRPFHHVVPELREAGFDGFVCNCGQHLLLQGQTVFRHAADEALSRRIAEKVRACGLSGFYEAEEGVWGIADGPGNEGIADQLALIRAHNDLPVYTRLDEGRFRFDKFCFWCDENSRTEEFLRWVSPYYTSTGGEGGGVFHELILNGFSKQTGVEAVLRQYGIPKENAYAVGDSINDVPMFRACGHTAAMGDGDDRLKAVAETVSTAADRDGVKNALRTWALL